MSTFVKKRSIMASEEGNTDDLMMCLVIFGWLSNQPFFKEMTDTNARQMLYEEQQAIEQDMRHSGSLMTEHTSMKKVEVDEYGDVWHPVTRKRL